MEKPKRTRVGEYKFPFPVVRLKRGAVHPITGKLFEGYSRGPYGCYELWITKEDLDKRTTASRERARKEREENPQKVLERKRLDRLVNKERVAQENKRASIKRRSTPIGRMICNLRSRTSMFVSQTYGCGTASVTKLLGCTFDELMIHLESHFKEGMTRDNYGKGAGKWCVDHHIPLISAKTEEELRSLVNYKNLRPLWWLDNISKKDKMPPLP